MSHRFRGAAVAVLTLCALLQTGSAAIGGATVVHEVRTGWYLWDPYQYEEIKGDAAVLEGLDVQLLRSVFKQAGFTLTHRPLGWHETLAAVENGSLDVAAGAGYSDDRARFAWFSDPYRTETDVLIVRKGQAGALSATSVPALLARLAATKSRIGVVRGFSYGAEVDDFVSHPPSGAEIEVSATDNENIEKLADEEIDGFFADRLVADTIAWRAGTDSQIEEHPVTLSVRPVHVMFSKASTNEAMVTAFNASLAHARDDGSYNRIARHYLAPLLLRMTVNRPWFGWLDAIGTIAFAISGVLLARKERYNLFGAFVLAALPAVGGGALRDILTERRPVGILRTPSTALIEVLITVLVGAIAYRIYDRVGRRRAVEPIKDRRFKWSAHAVELCDALGLSAFIVTGVVIAVEQRCEPLWLWGTLLAAMTGAGGGILRDIVRADPGSSSLKRGFYVEVGVLWGLALSLFLSWETSRLSAREVSWAVLVTMAGAFVTRMIIVRYGIQAWNLGAPSKG